mmetsp:Transcript_9646/g.17614  ORF Transcript_9646/g.17614 Transcript_9646/m.17614 type:complete len:287 (+) Transcript_9646:158-1018(+)
MLGNDKKCSFRPCIDLRNGRVVQIVGSTLKENAAGSQAAVTNFESEKSAAYFANLYRTANLKGGHVIMLGPNNEEPALEALRAFPGGLQVGGGITPTNARKYLEAGASHVIVTSYVFKDGKVDFGRLEELVKVVGKERLVLDLSCRRRSVNGMSQFFVVTDRWQKFTDLALEEEGIVKLAGYCSEFLVHGVDVEGKRQGVETELVQLLGMWSPIPVTYAGGIRSMKDIQLIEDLGCGMVDFTIGSALDIFGGDMKFETVAGQFRRPNANSTCNTTCSERFQNCQIL